MDLCLDLFYVIGKRYFFFKAALVNHFILTMEEMAICNSEEVACSDEPKEKNHPTLQFP